MSNNNAGKGDKPRNCFSNEFKFNYEEINWGHKSYKPCWERSLDSKKQKNKNEDAKSQ
jgi:hypothetical protein